LSITSSCIPLAVTQSHGHTQLQGRLGNVVQLFAQEEKEIGCGLYYTVRFFVSGVGGGVGSEVWRQV
jgi:hypothetical protein